MVSKTYPEFLILISEYMLKHNMAYLKCSLLSYYEYNLNPLNALHQVCQVSQWKREIYKQVIKVEYPVG